MFAIGSANNTFFFSDMIVASPRARFGLPEASRGLYAGAGGLSRLVRQCGMVLASEVAMAGRQLSAQEAERYLIINKISKTHESLIDEAVEMASKIAALNPDAIIVTRHGLRQSWEQGSVERASQLTADAYGAKLAKAENTLIGLAAFAQKKEPQWVPSKL